MSDLSNNTGDGSAPLYVVFEGETRLATGDLGHVALAAKQALARPTTGPVLVFDDATGEVVDLDLRGTDDDVLARPARPDAIPRGRGRPKLGVTAREVTLLPRHWDWLAKQPGGASAALRKLVEAARRTHEAADIRRAARDAAYRFMVAVGGNLPDFEEASRALFAGDNQGLEARTASWPVDVRKQLLRMTRRGDDQSPIGEEDAALR